MTKHPELPDVPLVMDFAKTDEQRQILKMVFARNVMGRPYVAPPNVPADRVAVLRQAFMDTMKDKDFLAEADKMQLEINPVSGAEVEKLVNEVYATPPDIVAKAKQAAAVAITRRCPAKNEALQLQRSPHHRHAAAADRQRRKLAVALFGRGFEKTRPAHVDALRDTQLQRHIALRAETGEQSNQGDIGAAGGRVSGTP